MHEAFLWVLAAAFAAFGGVALAVPLDWYLHLPGASDTGPANTHFIRDIGIAYLTLGLATALAARTDRHRWPLLLVVAFNTFAHAALHGAEQLAGGHPHGFNALEAVLVYGSVALVGAVLWISRPGRQPRSQTDKG